MNPTTPHASSACHRRPAGRSLLLAALHAFFVCALATTALGQVSFVPSGLNPGDEYHIAFITADNSGQDDAQDTGIDEYNDYVTNQASQSSLTTGADYFVIASTEAVDAKDNIGSSTAPIYLVNDTLLANGTADLFDGTILSPLQVDQFGTYLSEGDRDVWTGSKFDGTAFTNHWLGSANPRYGEPQYTDPNWISLGEAPATNGAQFYAISEKLVVPAEGGSGAPVAEAGGPYSGAAGEAIAFDGRNSVDPDGYIGYAYWDFGDGSPVISGLTATHIYTTSGVFTATLTVGDNDGLTDTDDASVTVTAGSGNQAPIADPGGPYLAVTETPLTFDGTGSTDPDGTIVSYSWNFGDGTMGTGATPQHTYATADTYTVYLEVEDEKGAVSGASTTVEVSESNHPPMADAGGPYSGATTQSIAFQGAGTDPNGADDIVSYEWDFGDGKTGNGATVIHSYQTAGSYTATLTVRDSQGATGTDTAPVSIDVVERPPTADSGGPYSGSTGKAVTFNASDSRDPDGTITSYSWDFGDGNNGTGVLPTHTYASTGQFTVILTVTDNDGLMDTSSTFAVISGDNHAPVADAGGPYSGEATVAVQFTGMVEDEDPGTVTGEWNFGDGSAPVAGLTASHTYASDGVYTVTFTATDSAGLVGTDSTQATIGQGAQAPNAVAGGPYRAKAGTPITFDGSMSSDPDGRIISFHWTFGDGSSADGPNPIHTYSTPGNYTVKLSIRDDDTPSSNTDSDTTVSLIVTDNLPPTAVIEGPTSGLIGQSLEFDGTGSSDQDGSIVSYNWDFGDGTTSTGAVTGHEYTAAGTYDVTLQVVDNDGHIGTDTHSVEITEPSGIFVPSGLNPGDEYRIAFVTDDDRDATSSDIADYNTFVTEQANQSGFTSGVNYFAVASTETVDARDNIGASTAPIYLANDTLLADDTDDLWDGDILVQFRVDQFGVNIDQGDTDLWTGSQSDGTASPDAFLGPFKDSTYGQVQYTSEFWIDAATKASSSLDRFYAISEVLTVPDGVVPSITIESTAPDEFTITWTPVDWILKESTTNEDGSWVETPEGTTNPAIISLEGQPPVKLYRAEQP